jgi:hypothetical protein
VISVIEAKIRAFGREPKPNGAAVERLTGSP